MTPIRSAGSDQLGLRKQCYFIVVTATLFPQHAAARRDLHGSFEHLLPTRDVPVACNTSWKDCHYSTSCETRKPETLANPRPLLQPKNAEPLPNEPSCSKSLEPQVFEADSLATSSTFAISPKDIIPPHQAASKKTEANDKRKEKLLFYHTHHIKLN
ncbi:hypothetical protein AVEN_109780-1 [Araneus ventricosus]|uniref:Uncharacterized protein n=1 Tax=Araneus ventricosus TaxID=182803 RepID=A0A4Y2VSL3_ARAVE|nr:hypothetical protein AVEN_109780-1 [Araneus ventricosus]